MRIAPTLAVAAAVCVVSISGCGVSGSGGRPTVTETRTPGANTSVAPTSAEPSVAPSTAAPVAKPKPNPCAANRGQGKLVRVSVHRQHLWLCRSSHLAFSTAVTTGIPGEYTSTPTGDYRIQARNTDTVLTLITGDQYTVKYWIPFDAPLFGFHDSSWQNFPYGSARYKIDGSHGCIHVPLAAISFLYKWADVGTPVRIRA